MSREIKFRAWDRHRKCLTWPLSDEGVWFDGVISARTSHRSTGHDWYDLPLMQYTGLKDKNGVEIYEGDIIRIKNNHGYFIKKSVAWNNGNRWQGFRVGKGDREIEVIGNVYENPELLEAGKKGNKIGF